MRSPGNLFWNSPRQAAVPRVISFMEDATVGAILLWLLGVPIPIIIILLLLWH
jgi:hypothetical protein